MVTIMSIVSFLATKTLQPMMLAISVLMISIMSTITLFKTTMSSWISFIVILTFSSGMMTLFMYTTSFTANEKTKTSKGYIIIASLMTLFIINPVSTMKMSKQSMKMFTNMAFFMIMATILIMTMLSISNHGHHPNQTISTSF